MASKAVKIDIHNHDRQYESTKKSVRNADISKRNKELILDFERTCFLKEALSKPRRIKLMGALTILARDYARCDFDKMDKKAIEEVILKIDTREDYSVWTKQSYRTIVKKFLKWLCQGDNYRTIHGYPEIVSWINTNIKKKDKPKVQVSDLLTELEVKRLMDVAEHPRDKAFVSMIYELGARIGEIGNLRIKDVTRDDCSYIVDLHGKTGHRTPRIVISDPYITAWLNIHPMKDDAHSPMWVLIGNRDKCKPMEYGTFRKLILRLKEKAGIKKRLYPHLLINKQINEAQAKVYFGWVPSSTMLSEYSHLISSDVNKAILEIRSFPRSAAGLARGYYSMRLLQHEAITAYGGAGKELSANAFMPPFTLFTGFDFRRAAEFCTAISPKLYTMHWSVMVQFWGEINPGLDESLLVKALGHLFDLGDEITAQRLSDYGYPAPDQPHPIPDAPQTRKIQQVLAESGDRVQITPLVHGYGPLADFCRRLQIVADSSAHGVWINRYGYLSDSKLEAIGETWS